MSRSRFSFQLYLGWMIILSSWAIFSVFRSYLKPVQGKERSDYAAAALGAAGCLDGLQHHPSNDKEEWS